MAKEQKQRQHNQDSDDETEVEPKKLESDIDVDELLDEIDAVLESNAEEFVNSYIQKGGQ